jgi:hypothetical protein
MVNFLQCAIGRWGQPIELKRNLIRRLHAATAERTRRSMSLLAPVACRLVMQRTLVAALGKVVSEPSPFGRTLVAMSLPIALARALR